MLPDWTSMAVNHLPEWQAVSRHFRNPRSNSRPSVCGVCPTMTVSRHAEVDHLGHRAAVVDRDQNVAGLDVPVDDALLMRMLHGLKNGNEEFQPLASCQMLLITELGDWNAMDGTVTIGVSATPVS
jgi:hypothetical protein